MAKDMKKLNLNCNPNIQSQRLQLQ